MDQEKPFDFYLRNNETVILQHLKFRLQACDEAMALEPLQIKVTAQEGEGDNVRHLIFFPSQHLQLQDGSL